MTGDVVLTDGPGGGTARPPASDVDLRVDLGGIELPNPVLTASGCFASGAEIDRFYDVSRLGAVIVKSITLEPREGLPTPRMAETPSGMLNAIGLQNPGVEAFCERELPWLRKQGVPVFASIVGNTAEEFTRVAERLRKVSGVVALELNISCPNLDDRSRMFSSSAETTAAVVRSVRRVAGQPIFTKLSPDVTDIVEVARAAVDSGSHGLSVMNTALGMAVDVESFEPKLSTLTGGLSGPAVRPIAIRCVFQVAQAFPEIPIIGQGGVNHGHDVAEFLLAGARAVAVGTANFVNPRASVRITEELRDYLARKDIADVNDLSGRLKLPGPPSASSEEA